jgi:protein-L-isoaspartate(D-aspartate) O-methyltransferase
MEYAIARKRMVEEQLRARGIKDQQVLQVMLKVPRHSFVEEGLVPMAYNDHPLSIGEGQTISQPYIVAYMVECLKLRPEDRILEIGTGCGYVTAILAELGAQVYSIERLPPLLMKARKNLKRLGYKNIVLKLGDGTQGWPEKAPFDAILVSAASPQIPQPYLDQLAEGGRLILPIGEEAYQELVLVTKTKGKLSQETLSGCRFVKLMGKYGFHPS